MQNTEIRDTRRKQMFQVDDEYLNGYARLCGGNATLVYLSLCRHANKFQKAWPSHDLIAEELAISKRSVIRGMNSLEEWNIIQVHREKDEKTKRQKVNIYVLVDKSRWRTKPGAFVTPGSGCQIRHEPGDKNDIKPGDSQSLEGNTKKKETHIKEEEVFFENRKALDKLKKELVKKFSF